MRTGPRRSESPVAGLTSYEVGHLAAHLEASGRAGDLHRLMELWWVTEPAALAHRDVPVSAQNPWFAAHDRTGDLAGFASDVARAWRLAEAEAEEQIGRGEHAEAIGLEARYALSMASLRTLAANIPTSLVVRLVETGEWTLAHGLDQARIAPTAQRRAETLAALAVHVPERERARLLEEALEQAWAVRGPPERIGVVVRVATSLPQAERRGVLDRAFSIAIELDAGSGISDAFASLAPHLPERLLSKAVAAAKTMDEYSRRYTLTALARYLPKRLATEALRVAQAIEFAPERAEVIAHLARGLGEPTRSEVLEAAVTAANAVRPDWDVENGALLLPSLSGERRTALVRRLLAGVEAETSVEARGRWVAELAPHLDARMRARALEETLAVAEKIEDEDDLWMRADVLVRLTPLLPARRRRQLIEEALEALEASEGYEEDEELFGALVPHMPQRLLPRTLAIALELARAEKTEALAVLATRLPTRLVHEALHATRAVGDEDERAQTLVALASHLPETLRTDVLQQAVAAARTLSSRDRFWGEHALARLMSHMSGAQATEALAAARAIEADFTRADALIALLPELEKTLKDEAWTDAVAAIRRDDDPLTAEGRARRLTELATHCAEPTRTELLEEALAAVRTMLDNEGQALVLSTLAPLLPESLNHEALAITRAISGDWWRADAIAAIAPKLHDALMPEALAVVKSIREPGARAQALEALAPHLPESQLEAALAAAPKARLHRAHALAALAPRLHGAEREEALEYLVTALRTLRDDVALANRVPEIAPLLPVERKAEIVGMGLQAALRIDEHWQRAYALRQLAPFLQQPRRSEMLEEALAAARAIHDDEQRAQELAHLAPDFTQPKMVEIFAEALAVARRIEEQTARTKALSRLLAHMIDLAPSTLHRLWSETLRTSAERTRAEVLADLRALGQALAALGGTAAVEEVTRAVRDTSRWWS